MRHTFRLIPSMASALNHTVDPKWLDIYANFPPYPINNITGTSKPVFTSGFGPTTLLPDPVTDRGGNPKNIFPVFPGDDVGTNASTLLVHAGMNSVLTANCWGQGNAFTKIFSAAARVVGQCVYVCVCAHPDYARECTGVRACVRAVVRVRASCLLVACHLLLY